MKSMFRLLAAPIVNQFITRIRSEAPRHWDTLKVTNKQRLYEKATNLNNWYTKFLRLDEVKQCQDRVAALQERLLDAQERRREIGRSLAELRKRSNLLQDELHKVKRHENLEKFLSLMKEETEVLKLESEVARNFQECDQAERELFTAFTNAVRDSHEKQRAQLEYTKYFGIILSIAGSFLAFCYTSLRKDDLKRFIEDRLMKEINFVKRETQRLGEEIGASQTSFINFQRNQNRAVTPLVVLDQERIERQILISTVGLAAVVFFMMLMCRC